MAAPVGGNRGRLQVNQIQSSEMGFLRRTEGCIRRDRLGKEGIKNELHLLYINDTFQKYATWNGRNVWAEWGIGGYLK